MLRKIAKSQIIAHSWWILSLAGIICITLLVQGGAFSATKISPKVTTIILESYQPVATPTFNYQPLATTVPILALQAKPTSLFLPLRELNSPTATATPTPLPTNTATITPPPMAGFHLVQKGEVLASIAAKYGVTTESLLLANNLDKSASLHVGQNLVIPLDPSKVNVIYHTVKDNDTLLGIAAKYNSSVENITKINPNLTANSLKAGQVLTIPVVFSWQPTPQIMPTPTSIHHIVRGGETPLEIAYKYNIPVDVLLAVNDIADPTLLPVGKELIIPPADGLSLAVPIILHEVAEGDSLLSLAAKYGSSVRDVLMTNPDIVPDSLKKGQIVAIPMVFPQPRPTPRPSNRPAGPRRPAPPPPPAFPDLATQMVYAINIERAAHKLPALKADAGIAAMAVEHAQDMIVRGFFAHVNPDGQTVRARFLAHKVSSSFFVGENIQRNSQPADKTVAVALAWFMGSPPHRNNILHQHFNRVGVGIVQGPGEMYTIVLNFSE